MCVDTLYKGDNDDDAAADDDDNNNYYYSCAQHVIQMNIQWGALMTSWVHYRSPEKVNTSKGWRSTNLSGNQH
jgi:hypothetical protein